MTTDIDIPKPHPKVARYKDWFCDVVFSKYEADGSPAIMLMHHRDKDLVGKATVYHSTKPNEGCVWVKDYSENEGMLACLVDAQIVRPTGRVLSLPYGHLHEARILVPKEEW